MYLESYMCFVIDHKYGDILHVIYNKPQRLLPLDN
jgi:hypothetical protein